MNTFKANGHSTIITIALLVALALGIVSMLPHWGSIALYFQAVCGNIASWAAAMFNV